MRELRVAAGDVLFRAGEPATSYYLLVEGSLRVGAAQRSAPDETVGWLDAVLQRPRRADAVATEAAHVFEIPIADFTAVAEDSLDLSLGLVEERARRVQAMSPVRPSRVLPTDDAFARTMVTLRDADCLRTARIQTLASLAEATTPIALGAGDLFTAGENGLWVVGNGLAESEGRRYGPGTVVGGTSAFLERARPRPATAVSPTQLLHVRFDDWFDVAEESFDLVRSTLVWIEEERESGD